MTEKELIELGYIPKELPPPFQSKTLANKLSVVKKEWAAKYSRLTKTQKENYKESKWTNHSIPKVGFSRRIISIPNPLHQTDLCETIANKWAEIDKIFDKSSTSLSIPVKDDSKQRAVITKHNFGEFKRKRLTSSFDKLYEIKTDISRFYGTIYTHSIPWLLHTKKLAKERRNDFTLLGNLLDKRLRVGNSGQTIGIPVGPDTSLIIAEIINCSIDSIIQTKLKNHKCFRFIDDFYVYCESFAEAEKAFKIIQGLLTEYQLDINEEKTIISKSPFAFESKWSIELGSFTFRKRPQSQLTDIERFVSLSFIHSNENPKDSVLLFSIQVLKYLKLFDENWTTYESLILKIGITEPRTLPVVTEILSSHKKRISKKKIKTVIENIIKSHVQKGHNFEVSWALWMCVEFEIKLPNKISELIFKTTDVISILIGLDLKNRSLINPTVSTDNLKIELTKESLSNENWLLTYESIFKGWLGAVTDPTDENEYFKILKKHNVTFYDETARMRTFKVQKEVVEAKPSTKTDKKAIAKEVYSGGGGGGY